MGRKKLGKRRYVFGTASEALIEILDALGPGERGRWIEEHLLLGDLVDRRLSETERVVREGFSGIAAVIADLGDGRSGLEDE